MSYKRQDNKLRLVKFQNIQFFPKIMEDSIYIYLLPYNDRTKLSILLDQNDKWQLLAKLMGYDDFVTQSLKREKSPSDYLLTLWGKQNHKIIELFILLSRMKHRESMEVIRAYVPEKYHRLMPKVNANLNHEIKINNNAIPDTKIANDNFNNVENKIENDKKIQNLLKPDDATRDDNVTTPPQRSPIPAARANSAFSAKSDMSYIADSGIPHITYEELQKSTDNWNQTYILGKGGFGIVFKGTWKCTKVAIKRIEEKGSQSPINPVRQTVTELNSLNTYRHDNILPLYGFSFDGPHNCLIYQYMSGGSLERRIRTNDLKKLLNWESRLKIAIGSARGIQFLHTTSREPLIHGDIKPANILLDENDTPRIGDFGLARKGPSVDRTHLTISHLQGTKPYLPDEYLRGGKLSTKVDTYSFGIVLFELATGLGPYSERRKNRFLRDHVVLHGGDIADLSDARLPGSDGYFLGLIGIGKRCTEQCPRARPEMVEALIALEDVFGS